MLDRCVHRPGRAACVAALLWLLSVAPRVRAGEAAPSAALQGAVAPVAQRAESAPAPAAGSGSAPAASAPSPAESQPRPRARSIFTRPLYLETTPPETRSARAVLISWRGLASAGPGVRRTQDEARALAEQVGQRLRAGEAFGPISAELSSLPSARTGGVLGTFAPGMLGPAQDAFLFAQPIGAVSEPLEGSLGWLVMQRIETEAACRALLVAGSDEAARERCLALRARALAGEDFRELARQHSDDAATRARGGDLAIFERGPIDQLIKAAAFELPIGAISEPVATPMGFQLVQRVPLDALDPALGERVWVRARAILIAQHVTPGTLPTADRSEEQAEKLAHELYERILAGADMAELARAYDDDYDGRARSGDLGWIHRRTPGKLFLLEPLYSAAIGEVLEPVGLNAGWAILRREG